MINLTQRERDRFKAWLRQEAGFFQKHAEWLKAYGKDRLEFSNYHRAADTAWEIVEAYALVLSRITAAEEVEQMDKERVS